MRKIHSQHAPSVVGPYSQALEANGFVFCAGQIGIDPKTDLLVEGLENQVNQIMKNLLAVLQATDLSLENVIKTTIYVVNMNDYSKVNEIYGYYFPKNKPARATVEVSKLPKGALVEIDAVAVKENI